ncbi:MAG: SufE family protein [Alphaproteobacteria bacterium]|nr:SufE family protein [Alphaproteobacteria bacterium]
MTDLPAFSEIADNLSFLDDWEDRYRYLIELGQMLPPLSEDRRTADTKVTGCVSQVWLVATGIDGTPPRVHFAGDSDAMIVKGLVAVLLALYSGRPAAEIAGTDAIAVLDELGLREHLTAQRSNGLQAMVKRMRAEAAALA